MTWLRKKPRRVVGPRQNQWKGSRAAQAADQRQQARRRRLRARWTHVFRVGGWIAGGLVAGWVIVIAAREMGPILQQGLEIREVQVNGMHHVTKQEVLDRLALKPGIALHQISASYFAERLRVHPWIKNASVERMPPHTLSITVLERKPAAIVRTSSGNFLSDEEGSVLSQLGTQDDPTYPLLIGFDAKALGQREVRVRQTVQSGVVLAGMIATAFDGRVEIDATNPSNLVALTKGVRFQFGSAALRDQWERFRKVRSSLKLAALDGKKRDVSEVDLRYDNRVIVRERG